MIVLGIGWGCRSRGSVRRDERAGRGRQRISIAALTCATAVSLAATACSSGGGSSAGPASPSAGQGTREFTDAAGRKLAIPAEARQLGLPFPYNTSDAILLGACGRIATTTKYSLQQSWVVKFCPSITGKATPYETPGAWNIEQVLGSEVDLQFAPSGDSADLHKLTSAGVPTLVLPDFSTLEGLSAAVGFEGRALGGDAPQRARAYQQYLASKLAMITAVTSKIAAARRPSVLAVDSDAAGSIHVLGAGTIMNQWIGIAGGINAARSIAGAAPAEVSAEQIQKWNPDVIIAGLPADAKAIMADPRLRSVQAVVHHKVLTNPAGTIIWMYYGTEEALNIQWAARELHPALFPDLDMAAVTAAFYRQFFGYQLSAAQVASILHPAAS